MAANPNANVLVSWSVQRQVPPLVIAGAKGCWLWDLQGKRYLDFSSQLINSNVGHQHPKIVEAIKRQADKLCYVAPSFGSEERSILARMLSEVAPGDMPRVFFTTGGTEANENAIKMARQFTGRHKIISRWRSFHGGTFAAMTLGGDNRRWAHEPGIPGVVRVFDPYCYRCTFGKTPDSCARECVSHIEEAILNEGPDNVAAIVCEGVSGTGGGIITPVDDYWPRLRALRDKYGILLISDEVMTGFGRTGEWFAVDNWQVKPDIITFAKGSTCGYVPLGGCIVSRAISDYFEDHMFWGGLTYSGHPLACAAGIATINVYKDEGLVARSKTMGSLLKRKAQALAEKHPSIGDVRGIGLFVGVELVKNRDTKEMLVPWNGPSQGVMNAVREKLMELGVYCYGRWNILFLAPPLIVDEREMDFGIQALDEALKIADAAAEQS